MHLSTLLTLLSTREIKVVFILRLPMVSFLVSNFDVVFLLYMLFYFGKHGTIFFYFLFTISLYVIVWHEKKNRILLRKQKENWLLVYNVLGGKLDLLLSIRMSMFIFESLCLFWFKTSLTTVHLGLMTKLSNHAHVMKRYCFVTWLRWWNIEMTRKNDAVATHTFGELFRVYVDTNDSSCPSYPGTLGNLENSWTIFD
jgi:hypothetical protein